MKQWNIVYRDIANPISTGVIATSKAIPAYITPLIGAFEAHHLNDGPPLEGALAQGYVGDTVWFYLEYTDSDDLIYGFELDRGDGTIQSYELTELIRLDSGFLFPFVYESSGEFTPEISMKWRDESGAEQTTNQEISNPPVSIIAPFVLGSTTFVADYAVTVPGVTVPCTWSVWVHSEGLQEEDVVVTQAEGVDNL